VAAASASAGFLCPHAQNWDNKNRDATAAAATEQEQQQQQ